MLGDERVVVNEALVNAGESSGWDDVGGDESGVMTVDEIDAGEVVLDKSEDILTAWIMRKGLTLVLTR